MASNSAGEDLHIGHQDHGGRLEALIVEAIKNPEFDRNATCAAAVQLEELAAHAIDEDETLKRHGPARVRW